MVRQLLEEKRRNLKKKEKQRDQLLEEKRRNLVAISGSEAFKIRV